MIAGVFVYLAVEARVRIGVGDIDDFTGRRDLTGDTNANRNADLLIFGKAVGDLGPNLSALAVDDPDAAPISGDYLEGFVPGVDPAG